MASVGSLVVSSSSFSVIGPWGSTSRDPGEAEDCGNGEALKFGMVDTGDTVSVKIFIVFSGGNIG